jgi:dihydrofolate synthase / folylpolyglutamate synthase
MHFQEAVQYLLHLGHETSSIKLGLSNIKNLLKSLGHPHQHYQSVQIAGTNGKGSTAAMLNSICQAAQISTGLYTSPHLVSITERIRINNQEISAHEFARITALIKNIATDLYNRTGTLPTFFEHVTAIALEAFRQSNIKIAILETGMGGRLDATTAADANLVAIAPIGLDHQEYLGSTLEEIAAEKAAIIRPGAIAIVAPQCREALNVIEKRCQEIGTIPIHVKDNIKIHGTEDFGKYRVTINTSEDSYENMLIGLRGKHQIINASVAIYLAEALRMRGFPISRDAIIEGIKNVKHRGRLELILGTPSLLFDGAHNQAGASALREYLDEFIHSPITLIFGAMRDKDLNEIAGILFPIANHLILTQPESPRAATVQQLQQVIPPNYDRKEITFTSTTLEALHKAFIITEPDGVICITGSLYLVGEALNIKSKENLLFPFT